MLMPNASLTSPLQVSELKCGCGCNSWWWASESTGADQVKIKNNLDFNNYNNYRSNDLQNKLNHDGLKK